MSTLLTNTPPKSQLTAGAADILNRYTRILALFKGSGPVADDSPFGYDRAVLTEAHRFGAGEDDIVSMLMARHDGGERRRGEEHVRALVRHHLAEQSRPQTHEPVGAKTGAGRPPAKPLSEIAARLVAIEARLSAIESTLAAMLTSLSRT